MSLPHLFFLPNPRSSVGFLLPGAAPSEVLASLSPAVCLWDPGFPPLLPCFLISKWGITVFLHMVFWKHPAQGLAGSRCPSESVCFLPPRRADSSMGTKFSLLPLSFLLFLKSAPSPLKEGVLWFLTSGKLCCGGHGNSHRFLPEGQGMLPLAVGAQLAFLAVWAPGSCPEP